MTFDEFLQKYKCSDGYGESCDGDCKRCEDEIRKDLDELIKERSRKIND